MEKKDFLDNMISNELNRLETAPNSINDSLISKLKNKKCNNNIIIFLFFILAYLQGFSILLLGITYIANLFMGLIIVLSGLFIMNNGMFLYILLKKNKKDHLSNIDSCRM